MFGCAYTTCLIRPLFKPTNTRNNNVLQLSLTPGYYISGIYKAPPDQSGITYASTAPLPTAHP